MIEFIDVYKEDKNGALVLNNISFSIESGIITVFTGEENCGTSHIVDLIFGIEKAESGDIYIMDKDIKMVKRKQLYRAFGYIDSKMDLLSHMTVLQNVAIPLYLENMDMDDVEKRVEIVLDMVGLKYEDYASKYPKALSQFEQQKIRIARAISAEPYIIVMDDPFNGLEKSVSDNLTHEILRIQQKLDLTLIYTTSSIEQALKIGDKIGILESGSLVQFDTPNNLLKAPKNNYVEYFVGKKRMIRKAEMFVAKDVMNKKVATVHMNQSYCQAMQIMRNQNTNILVVVDVDRSDDKNIAIPIGLISPKQISRAYKQNLNVSDVMRRDIKTIDENMSLTEVLKLREKFQHANLPVVDNNKSLKGIIDQRSILNVENSVSPDVEEIV
jgi:osmoprotectant transport system ATP-binding protein